MAWEWSHSPEAYQDARLRLHLKPRRWLEECWAEIEAERVGRARLENTDNYVEQMDDWLKDYNEALHRARSRKHPITLTALVDSIWEFAEEQRTCDNGGFNFWVCPSGCHKVSADTLTDAQYNKATTIQEKG